MISNYTTEKISELRVQNAAAKQVVRSKERVCANSELAPAPRAPRPAPRRTSDAPSICIREELCTTPLKLSRYY
ncbi:hypothetical protein EVAR_75398_1 [Eumeta japonica]|uniref:Uncharacterized protein n=1 Tax=Eumeta variegata TaxID=151549 RepID=A0A4C1TL76_EUMVA|nr:hypothetical protein EVAR_75398_1 [Eumeta japonica]